MHIYRRTCIRYTIRRTKSVSTKIGVRLYILFTATGRPEAISSARETIVPRPMFDRSNQRGVCPRALCPRDPILTRICVLVYTRRAIFYTSPRRGNNRVIYGKTVVARDVGRVANKSRRPVTTPVRRRSRIVVSTIIHTPRPRTYFRRYPSSATRALVSNSASESSLYVRVSVSLTLSLSRVSSSRIGRPIDLPPSPAHYPNRSSNAYRFRSFLHTFKRTNGK